MRDYRSSYLTSIFTVIHMVNSRFYSHTLCYMFKSWMDYQTRISPRDPKSGGPPWPSTCNILVKDDSTETQKDNKLMVHYSSITVSAVSKGVYSIINRGTVHYHYYCDPEEGPNTQDDNIHIVIVYEAVENTNNSSYVLKHQNVVFHNDGKASCLRTVFFKFS